MLKHRLYQIIIALDQLFNALCFGWADETFSARCWRQKDKNSFWAFMRRLVDCLFWWDTCEINGKKLNHCEWAHDLEEKGGHRPREYRFKPQL